MAKHTTAKPSAEPAPAPAPAAPKPARYRVSLRAATPLRDATLDVEAETEGEAWRKFCEHNGISDSACERSIERLEG